MQPQRYFQAPNVLSEHLSSGEVVLLHLTDGLYFTLNETGSIIWSLLASGASPAEIADELSTQFEVASEEAHRSVVDLVEELQSRMLLAHTTG